MLLMLAATAAQIAAECRPDILPGSMFSTFMIGSSRIGFALFEAIFHREDRRQLEREFVRIDFVI